MLRHLAINDFVIVHRADLEISSGFTVLTGETGAGKSMLIDALGLLLGARAEGGLVRTGHDKADLQAEFDTTELPEVDAWLEAHDLAGDPGVLLLRRTIDRNGRSRAFINGRPATQALLKEVGEWLVDIHGQHAHQSLLKAEVQRQLVDDYAQAAPLVREVGDLYRGWQLCRRRREEAARLQETAAHEADLLRYQISEVERLNLHEDSYAALEAEHARLTHAATLLEGAQAGVEALSESDAALAGTLHIVRQRLSQLAAIDAGLIPTVELLESAEIEIKEAASNLRHYAQGLDLDADTLGELDSRMQAIQSAARKYRVLPEELPNLLDQWRARLQELDLLTDLADLLRQEEAALAAYRTRAAALTAARRQSAAALAKKISAAMQDLAMAGGRFEVVLLPLSEPTAGGLEAVDFRVAPHHSLEARPLAKVASGGELSRISLAIQVATSEVARVPTLIFDEVDVGVGGRVAEMVGQLLRRLGESYQVFCITHLPQVAALGEHHWQVLKLSRDGNVESTIRVLDEAARVEEISRMLGGVEITETTRAHASEMLAR